MVSLLDRVYQVFSSAAALAEISTIGLIAAFLTYYGDRRKRIEIRNASLLEIRKPNYDRVIDTLKNELKIIGLRFASLLVEVIEAKEGHEYQPDPVTIYTKEEVLEKLYVARSSRPMSLLLGRICAAIKSQHDLINVLRELYDPSTETVSVMGIRTVPANDIYGDKLIRVFESLHKTAWNEVSILEKQYESEISNLLPKETKWTRFQSRKQIRRNSRLIASIWKEEGLK